MSKIVPFLFEGEQMVRVVDADGAPRFVAADVCKTLGIQNVAQAIAPLDDDEKGICSTYTPGGPQEVLVINESGLYTLILRSRDAISQAKPMTLDGMRAKARAAKKEAQNPRGPESPNQFLAARWSWDLVNDLLRIDGGAVA